MSADPTPADVYEAIPEQVKRYRSAVQPYPELAAAIDELVTSAYAAGRAAATPDGGEWTTEYGLINENTREFVPFSSWTEACAFAQGRQVMRRQVWRGQVFEAREGGRPVEAVPAPDATETGR